MRTAAPCTATMTVARLVEHYLDVLRDHEPVIWTRLGGAGRDRDLPDRSPEGVAARGRALAALHADVVAARDALPEDAAGEHREARDDLVLLADELAYRRHLADVRQREHLDPLAALDVAVAGIHELLRRTDLPTVERARRARAALDRSRALPAFLERSGALLVAAPAPHLRLALDRLPSVVSLVRDHLPATAVALGVGVAEAESAARLGAEGLEAYGALLDELRAETPAPWRLGPDHHAVALRIGVGSSLDATEIVARAEAAVVRLHGELAELAASGWVRRHPGERPPRDPHERVRRALADVADTAVGRDEVFVEARRAMEEAYAFTARRGIVDLPPTGAPADLAEVPAHLAGIAAAFVVAPPPLDDRGRCAMFLAAVPPSWDGARSEAFLREHTPAQLRSLALHEGYPGHVVQLEHAARHPRLVRRLVTRPVFAEGWAIHAEREAVLDGFADDDTSVVDGDDYRLVQRRMELRIAVDALLDVGLHAGDLSRHRALDLLTNRGLHDRDEAEGRLLRAKLLGGQLSSYFAGGEELADLRAEVAAREGAAFDRRRFHQDLLSHGTPTVAVLRRALADPGRELRRPFAR